LNLIKPKIDGTSALNVSITPGRHEINDARRNKGHQHRMIACARSFVVEVTPSQARRVRLVIEILVERSDKQKYKMVSAIKTTATDRSPIKIDMAATNKSACARNGEALWG